MLSVAAPAMAILVILVSWLTAPPERTAAGWITLAESQIESGALEQAAMSLEMAVEKRPGSREQQLLDAARSRLKDAFAARADQRELDAALRAQARLQRFESAYLVGREDTRPAARELMRQIEEWRDQHQALCARSTVGRRLIGDVDDLERRYAALAAMNEADTVEDARFRVLRRTWMRPRHDRAALQELERVRGVLGDEAASALRAEILEGAATARDAKLGSLRALLARDPSDPDRRAQVLRDLRFLVEEGLPESLVGPAREMLEEVERGARDAGNDGG